MKFEIKDRWDAKEKFSGDFESFRDCVLSALSSKANLSWADLSGADLSGANLSGANLSWADLSGANLYGANLYGAKNFNFWKSDSLRMLLDQPGKIRAYKLANQKNEGPFNGGLVYEKGKIITAKANKDENVQCAEGISLATLPWCIASWKEGYKIMICEFTAKDIAAIPYGTDGKFRVSKCKVIKEVDYKKIGLA